MRTLSYTGLTRKALNQVPLALRQACGDVVNAVLCSLADMNNGGNRWKNKAGHSEGCDACRSHQRLDRKTGQRREHAEDDEVDDEDLDLGFSGKATWVVMVLAHSFATMNDARRLAK